jgi:GT2 family glycosyltransferase
MLPGGGADGQFTRYGYPRRLTQVDRDQDVEFMQGCFMAARLDVARTVGFDESMPGYALAEDEDFSYRLSRHGRLRYLAGAVVHHDSGGFQSRDRRAFGRLVVSRRAYLVRKNFDPTLRTWLGFSGLVLVFIAHRLVNRDFLGAVGLLEGSVDAIRGR